MTIAFLYERLWRLDSADRHSFSKQQATLYLANPSKNYQA